MSSTFTRALSLLTLITLLTTTPARAASRSPGEVVNELYEWVFANGQSPSMEQTAEKGELFEEDFLDALTFAMDTGEGGEARLDFSPFVNAQEEFDRYKVDQAEVTGESAIVPVYLMMPDGGEAMTIRVKLARMKGKWKVINFLYEEGDLKSIIDELQQEK